MGDTVASRTAGTSTFFDDLVAKRRLFIDGLDANEGEINLNIFEDFIPTTHFVYELLQKRRRRWRNERVVHLSRPMVVFPVK